MFRATSFSVFAALAFGEDCNTRVEAPSPGCAGHWWGDSDVPKMDLWCPGAPGVAPAVADDDYKCYKIPSLMRTGDGTLLAFIEARKEHCGDSGWIDIRLRRSFDNGDTWTQSSMVYSEGDAQHAIAIGDQCPVWDEATQTVHLIFTRNNADTMYTSSTDHGATWAAPRDISTQVGGPHVNTGSGHAGGLQLASGRLIIPMHKWSDGCHEGPKKCYGIYSDDHGQTWQEGGEAGDNECQFQPLPNGTLIAVSRRGGVAGILSRNTIAYSHDDGVTWTEPVENEGLPSPVGGCETSILAHPNGKLYHSGPESGLKNAGLRRNMVVKVSEDSGQTWKAINSPWSGAAAYSSLALLGAPDDVNADIGLLFERNRGMMIVFEASGQTFTRFHPDGTFFPAGALTV